MAPQMAPNGSDGYALGNTINPARIPASKKWCFTFFPADDFDLAPLSTLLSREGRYMFGEEICPETKRKHLQGWIEFKTKVRPMERIKLLKGAHWEKMKGSIDDNINYCSKEGKVHTNIKIPRPLIDPLANRIPNEMQEEVLKLVKAQDYSNDRNIYWFCDDGNTGKTTVCKHICMNYNAIVLSGRAADIKAGVASHIALKKELDIAIFHFVRSEEDYISYTAMENIKDGMYFSGKYESSMLLYNNPLVMVFANFEPDNERLTSDRWIVKSKLKKKEVITEDSDDEELFAS